MFTGIVTAIGTITNVEDRGDTRVVVACPWDPAGIDIGASIACSGVCLTVVEKGGKQGDAWFAVDVSGETVARTAQDQWRADRRLNLEPALRLGDELGGHLVTGHVDSVGRVALVEDIGGSTRLEILAGPDIAPFVAEKGSITVDGVSLTVNDIEDEANGDVRFALNIIPHTGEVTTLGDLSEGDAVNLEIDVLARYLKRMQSLAG
ncbi:riboflavin synthase [Qipengyuania flava]|jgi:riboflavin synthase|uniref:riboflavin synthase n=1 Tax=Qipengyuania flava TaxID=192812 RepID=UPI0007C372FE|nr:riboflavin synthase [Qipengyuania flava]KZX87780.1 riboflavin synthase subunit alpha [Erythrobacter sp. HI0020]KZY18052.1 riboflavin synthase subunit alpha [Erythrobacter sp. HI0037]KZY21979.1 riboflavin synthase subunit alpha [Erythrobacter sp. HI0038]NIJ62447.1 riboflavin synthase [Qipengyuania flava]